MDEQTALELKNQNSRIIERLGNIEQAIVHVGRIHEEFLVRSARIFALTEAAIVVASEKFELNLKPAIDAQMEEVGDIEPTEPTGTPTPIEDPIQTALRDFLGPEVYEDQKDKGII